MNKLWAPWREAYFSSQKTKPCFLCRIARSQRDRDHFVILRFRHSFAVLNLYPYNNGHTIIVPGGEKCGCGERGCLEAYASGTAIASFFREVIRGVGSSGKKITGEIVALAAKEKDPLALEAFQRAGYYLGIGLANLINLLNPEMLILGGSVMKSSRFLWPSMIRSARRHSWPSLFRACRIVKTRLDDRVGDLGALALVFSSRERSDVL